MKSAFVIGLLLTLLSTTGHSQSTTKKRQSPFSDTLLKEWKIRSSKHLNANGSQISSTGYSDDNWINAQVPTTVFNALVSAGIYRDIYKGMNMDTISRKPFKDSWWYRTVFDIDDTSKVYLINFEGINYKANIWLNGKLIATADHILNPFRQFKLRINDQLVKGRNVLAVEVFPPQPGDFTIGFVDWNPAPPDDNMGIFRNVILTSNYGVSVENPYIESTFKNHNYSETDLIFTTELKNYGNDTEGILQVHIGDRSISKKIRLKKDERKKIILTANDFKELHIKNPRLWWPHTLGKPELYHATVSFKSGKTLTDQTAFDFGIREVGDFFTKEGHRGFTINGHKILIRGGGWVDNMMLNDTPQYIKSQLEYVKDMNLNTIRLEGFWGKDHTLYEFCDQMGILIMVGWSCQWEWEDYLGKPADETYGGITSPQDIELISAAWRDQIVWLRNHPSIFTWFSGSDCIPKPELEKKYFEVFDRYDSTRVYLASAKEWDALKGPSGVKMRGPYAYVPPVYWFQDTLYGGAFGFNTETSPGANVPPLESIKKMIPEKDLWPINKVWNYHCGRKEFNTLDRFTKALNKRYGEAKDVEDYAFKAQLLNYELMRPMFEAFSANRYKATGVIQWMLNSAWPEMYWQLYDTYLMPNGAYYATKKAGNSLHALYNYNNHAIYVVNDLLKNSESIKVRINVYDIHSKAVLSKEIQTKIPANLSKRIFQIPEIKDLSQTYFLNLQIFKDGKEIDRNFYWLSRKKDILDYQAEVPSWYYHTPSKQYADFTQLKELKPAKLTYKIKPVWENEKDGFEIEMENISDQIAFFIELKITDTKTGNSILPVIWSDNYVSLLPGEKRKFKALFRKDQLKNIQTRFSFKGWNVNMQ